MRWRLVLGYDGTAFSGWAAQPGLRTVQGELEDWLPKLMRLDAPVNLVCAGRTDAGVHARGQVAHVDLPDTALDAPALQRRLDRALPADLVVRSVSAAPPGFDARFSAIWRRYVYRLSDGTVPDPLLRHYVVGVREVLDLNAVNAAGPALLGLRDFGAFCRRRAGASTVRNLLEVHADRRDGITEITVRADAFCHSMVRSLIGGLVAVGSGRRDLGWLAQVTATAVRDSGVTVMPPRGLTLEQVGYPPDDQLGERAEVARSRREVPAADE